MDFKKLYLFILAFNTVTSDDNNDGRRVCMNLLGKYSEVESSKHLPGTIKRMHIDGRNLFKTANLGDPCDLTLYNKFIKPIYDSTTRKDELEVIDKLNKHLELHPSLISRSCFGLTNSSRGRFYKCQNSSSGYPVCSCMDEHPWLFRRVPKEEDESECRLIHSTIGTPCDWERQRHFNEKLFQPHYDDMRNAENDAIKTEKALIKFGTNLMQSCEWEFSVGDIRSLCLGVTTNMECKKDNKCSCLEVDPYYTYVSKSGYCLAKRGSACLFEPKTKDGTPILFRSARCVDKSECTDPVLEPEYAEFDFHAFQVCASTSLFPSSLSLVLLLSYHYFTHISFGI